MIRLQNIHPLSSFQRNAKSHITRLKKTGEVEVLTVNGQAELVVLSSEAYQELLAKLELAETLNVAHQAAFEELRTGRIPSETLISELNPHPESAGIPVDEAFAEIRQRIERRREKEGIMSFELRLNPQAAADIDDIHAFLGTYSSTVADQTLDLIEQAILGLREFPRRYVVAPESEGPSNSVT